MAVISAADSLMAIFGYKRVQCAYCTFSIGTDKGDMLCAKRVDLVQPDDQCEEFMREPGADDE